MEMPGLREKLTVAFEAGRRAYDMVSQNKLPVMMEAETLKDLHIEDQGWHLVDGSRMDQQPWKRKTMLDVAFKLYRHNHMAGALLNIIVDFIWGDGISVQAKHKDESAKDQIQEVIDGFWDDPVNEMDRLGGQRIFELFLWGEITMPLKVNEFDGSVRVGWIDTFAVENVKSTNMFGKADTLTLSDTAAEQVGHKELQIVRYDPDKDTIDGNVFFYAINTTMSGFRGVSELYTASDWLDTLDDTLKSHSDRAKLDSHFIWDVLLEGYSDSDIRKWYKTHGKAPRPNSIRAHNEKVKWNAVAPKLGSADMEKHAKTLKTYIMGGFQYPNHWYASGDDANLATAAVMAEPTRKALKKKQKVIRGIITDMIRFALVSKQRHMKNWLPAEDFVHSTPFEVQIPDLAGPDLAKAGSAIQQITTAVIAAEQNELVSHETGQEIFAMVATDLGMEIDVQRERDKIEEESEDKNKKRDEEHAAMAREISTQLRAIPGGANDDDQNMPPKAAQEE